jgi:SAM-dependent methyltransferase
MDNTNIESEKGSDGKILQPALVEKREHTVVWDREKIEEYWSIFGNIKPVSPWFGVKARGFLIDELKRIHRTYFLGKRARILDLGSGSGEFLAALPQSDFDCYGVDLSTGRIEQAKKDHPDLSFKVGSLTETGHEDGFFDITISTQTIEHLLDEDLSPAFKEIQRILKPGGIAIFTTRFEEDLTKRLKVCPDCHAVFLHSQHLQSFSLESLDRLLLEAGLNPLVSKRSRCRDNVNELLPKKARFLSKLLYFIFGNYLDKKIGKYIFSVSQKRK